jgi:predicted nucleic acid-binding protein
MTYLLDTDVLIDHLEDTPTFGALLTELATDGIAISVISYLEAFEGVDRRGPSMDDAIAKLRALTQGILVIPVTIAIAERCALLRQQLRRSNRSVRTRAFDLVIAATALEHGLLLVTRNLDDYRDIPNLQLYQWSETEGSPRTDF